AHLVEMQVTAAGGRWWLRGRLLFPGRVHLAHGDHLVDPAVGPAGEDAIGAVVFSGFAHPWLVAVSVRFGGTWREIAREDGGELQFFLFPHLVHGDSLATSFLELTVEAAQVGGAIPILFLNAVG